MDESEKQNCLMKCAQYIPLNRPKQTNCEQQNLPAILFSEKWRGSWLPCGHDWSSKTVYNATLSAAILMNSRNPVCRVLDMGVSAKRILPQTCGIPLHFAMNEEELKVVRLLSKKSALPMQSAIIVKRQNTSYSLLVAAENENLEVLMHC